MKKKIFGAACILALSGILTAGQIISQRNNTLTDLENANIEALSNSEIDWQDILMYLRCWGSKYALNHALDVVDTKSGNFKCDANGNIKIGSEVIPTSLEAEVYYEIQYDIKKCKEAKYSCCNQNKVGISISSYTRL